MDDLYIVTVHYVIDSLAQTFMPEEKYHPKMSVAEILTVAIAAARYCGNNLEQALLLMRQIGYIPRGRCLSVSRFNRQLHKHEAFLELCVETLLELARTGDTYIIDSMPVPVCKRVRARRCRKVRGADFCGYCVAKKEKFFGWRLHLICTPDGRPANFTLLPASYHDLTPIFEITYDFPEGARFFADKGYNYEDGETFLALEGLRLLPIRKVNMQPHPWWDEWEIEAHRSSIETRNSQLESMGLERLKARTNQGFSIKVHASLVALWISQSIAN